MQTDAELKEELYNIEVEMDTAYAAIKAARTAPDEYEMNPANWNAPDYHDHWDKLYNAICDCSSKMNEIFAREDAVKKVLFNHPEFPNPVRDIFAKIGKQ